MQAILGGSSPQLLREVVMMRTSEQSMTGGTTFDAKLAKAFGLKGDAWLLAISIWSREWIGWWSLIPIALSLVFMMVNPLLFPKPSSTTNWASKGVFGERIWADRNKVQLPEPFRSPAVANVTYAFQLIGTAVLVYGLVALDVWAVISGIVIVQCTKASYIDLMVLLFEDMKGQPEYAAWEY
jgi:hypothetical protein